MTTNQRHQIRTGLSNIIAKANYAYHEYLSGGQEVGTIYSKREPRTYRGRRV